MTELVSKLKTDGNFVDAYLVAKNNLSRNIGDYSMFKQFIDLALELAMFNIVFEERKQYVNDAHTALVMFSESAELNMDIIAGIAFLVYLIFEALERAGKVETAELITCIAIIVVCVCEAVSYWNRKRIFSYVAIAGAVLLTAVLLLLSL